MGLGPAPSGVLERLDTLAGRTVDDVGPFAVSDM